MKPALAIARRDIVRWFSNPTGYVFITIFIAACAVFQFLLDRFFLDNLANLAPLNTWFPIILIFFAPVIAMGTWADERRHGTDELLLTLPVPDAALVLGKYLAVLAVYGVSLLFTLEFIIVLRILGRPDVGLMFGTYLGYAFMGAALIAIAMIGSLLVESVTVGFILGAVFCALAVFLGEAATLVTDSASIGVLGAFRDFAVGVVSLESIVYFAGLAVIGLAVNLYLIRRRRLRSGAWHLPVRLACIIVSFTAIGILAGRSGMRIDVTAERLHTLTPQTRETLKSIPADRPVFVQAYVSPEVPQEYVETRENLLGLLREVGALGGGRVHVRVTETTDASEAAREAEDRFKIRPMTLSEGERGSGPELEVYLGVAVTSGLEEVVVPFMYRGLSAEYEVTRSIRAVMNAKRAKVGVLATEAKWFGGFDFQSMRQSPPWEVVDELKRQYEVVSVAADAPIVEPMDVLIVPLPSSLPQPQMDNLFNYVKQGKPVLLLDDPLTGMDPSMGANEMRGGRRGMMGGGQPPEPKGNFKEFYRQLGIAWDPLDIVWDTYSPHPSLRQFDREIVFVGKGNGAAEPFSLASPITSKLQELVIIFGGCVRAGDFKGIQATPLVRAGKGSGILSYHDVWRSNPFMGGGGLNPGRRHEPSSMLEEPVFALRVQGKEGDVSVDAVVVADLDVASPVFYQIRRDEWRHFENLDNVNFVLNCVDALARDETMIALRSRRPRHRTLETVEAATRTYEKRSLEETRAEEDKATKLLKAAQDALDDAVKTIESREDLDAKTKEIMADTVRETEQRKFDVEKRRIEEEKKAAIRKSKRERDQQVSAIRNRIKWMALFLPPVPALAIALFALFFRVRRELEARR